MLYENEEKLLTLCIGTLRILSLFRYPPSLYLFEIILFRFVDFRWLGFAVCKEIYNPLSGFPEKINYKYEDICFISSGYASKIFLWPKMMRKAKQDTTKMFKMFLICVSCVICCNRLYWRFSYSIFESWGIEDLTNRRCTGCFNCATFSFHQKMHFLW